MASLDSRMNILCIDKPHLLTIINEEVALHPQDLIIIDLGHIEGHLNHHVMGGLSWCGCLVTLDLILYLCAWICFVENSIELEVERLANTLSTLDTSLYHLNGLPHRVITPLLHQRHKIIVTQGLTRHRLWLQRVLLQVIISVFSEMTLTHLSCTLVDRTGLGHYNGERVQGVS